MKKINYLFLAIILILLGGLGVLAQAQNDNSDVIDPAAISDLTVSTATVFSVTLTWTAPGDDNMVGTSTSYNLRYATTTITDDNWALAIEAGNEPTPQIASSTETMTVSGLDESTTYYFAIKTKDEEDNESDLSNIVSGTTLASVPAPSAEITLEMNFSPQSLNLSSQGRWVTIHLFLSSSYNVSDIDISTIKLNDSLLPDSNFQGVNQFKKGKQDKIKSASNLVLKFSRSDFVELVGENRGDFKVTITGEINGKTFSANDMVGILSITPEVEGTLVSAIGEPEVYIIQNGRKRHIPSSQAFNRQGLGWQNIKEISEEELDIYSDDELIKTSDNSSVYIIFAGMKRHIPSVEVFESYGLDWNDISIISNNELNDYPDTHLIRAAGDAKVYLLAGGKRHWIPTLAVFNKHGYKWDNVIIVNSIEKDDISEGDNVE